jgi:hypothetical protein
MAASKLEPRAAERVVASDIDGTRPYLSARSVYWSGASGVYRVRKSGGPPERIFATGKLTGFASDGDDAFLGTAGGIFLSREGEPPRLLRSSARPPQGLAIDGRFIYWLDSERDKILRVRR